MDGPNEEFRRCSRRGTPNWRCSERALSGRAMCEKHYLQTQKKRKMKKEEDVSGAGEITQNRKRRKKSKIEEKSVNALVGRAGDAAQDWFGHQNGGPNVDEEIARLFDEVQGNGVNLGCESLNLWYPGEEKRVQLGGFGEACENLGEILGDGVEFPSGYAEDGNLLAGLGQAWCSEGACGNGGGVSDAGLEDHGGGAAADVYANGAVGRPCEGIGGLVGPCDRHFQALLCQNKGYEEDVRCNSPTFATPDGLGVQGLSGESANGFRGEGVVFVRNSGGYGKCEEDKHVGSVEVPGSNGKHGWHKGSNIKKTVLGIAAGIELSSRGVATNNEARGETLRSQGKRGRPKGSKNKNKQHNMILNGETVSGNDNAGTNGMICVTVLETEGPMITCQKDKVLPFVVGAGDEDAGDIARPKKRGRPKGSKKRKNIVYVSNEVSGEIAGAKKHGRPMGSKNKMKNILCISNEVAGEIAGPKKRGRPKGSKNKRKTVVCASNEVAGEIAGPKKHGRPKGSKNKRKIVNRGQPRGSRNKREKLADQINQEMPDKIMFADKGSDIIPGLTGFGNNGTSTIDEEHKGSLAETAGSEKFGDEDVQLKKSTQLQHSNIEGITFAAIEDDGMPNDVLMIIDGSGTVKPIGLEYYMATLVSDGNQKMPSQAFGHGQIQNDSNHVKPKRGRPKGSIKKKNSIAGEGKEQISSETFGLNGVQDDKIQSKSEYEQLKDKKGNHHLTSKIVGTYNEEIETIRSAGPENGIIIPEIEADKEFSGRISCEYRAGNNFDKGKRKCGRPKDFDKKEKETAGPLDLQIERLGLVTEKDGRTSAGAASISDIHEQEGNYSQKKASRNTMPTIKHSQSRGSRGKTPIDADIQDDNEPMEFIHKSRMNVRGQALKSQNSTRFSRVSNRVMPQKQMHDECNSMLEDQVQKKEKSDFLLEYSKQSGKGKTKRKGLTCESGNVQKRSSGRLRKLFNQHTNFQGVGEKAATELGSESSGLMGFGGKETADHGSESSGLMGDTRRKKEPRTLMCHQCWRNDRSGIVICANCKRKRYCYECITKWYPEKTRKEIEIACPFCLGNCNCRLCLKEDVSVVTGSGEADTAVKLQKLFYLLKKTLPLLQHIQQEQISELEVEASTHGTPI